MTKGHKLGTLEGMKFNSRRENYYNYIRYLSDNKPSLESFLQDFAAYTGHMSLNRVLTIYELYKKTLGLAGHIADVGVYTGASSLLFAKLLRIFEPESLALCHGFDWFEGMAPSEKDSSLLLKGGYKSEYEKILELVDKQGFSDTLKIHKMNLLNDCPNFFEHYKHLRFKLVMMDAGTYEVMKAAIPYFWDRLNKGGIMIFDQYSCEFAQGETLAINELLPDVIINTIPNSWMPNAYIIKV